MWRSQWFVALAMSLISVNAGAETPREWVKERVEVEFDGEVYARWTGIATADGALPYQSRRLYEDNAGRRLVLRVSSEESATDITLSTSFRYLSTGEELAFVYSPGVLTVKLGIQELVVKYDELVAQEGEVEPGWPSGVQTQGARLIAGTSGGFRGALQYFSKIGCRGTKGIYDSAMLLSLVTGIDCPVFPEIDYARPLEV